MRVFPIFIAALLSTTAAAQDKPVVTVRALAEVAIHPERDAAAQVVSLNESRISAEIAGRIEAVPVEVGQRLEKGAVIARIDCRDHELARDQARAARAAMRSRLALAEQQLGRAKELSAQGFFAEEALAARSTEVAVLRADLAQADVKFAADERFGTGNCEDDDWCLRAAQAGWNARIADDVFVHHVGGCTFQSEQIDYAESLRGNFEILKQKWGMDPEAQPEDGYPFVDLAAGRPQPKVPLA
jgi:multidrug efflux pump subunit AcrA (membrane-fusion protein)